MQNKDNKEQIEIETDKFEKTNKQICPVNPKQLSEIMSFLIVNAKR